MLGDHNSYISNNNNSNQSFYSSLLCEQRTIRRKTVVLNWSEISFWCDQPSVGVTRNPKGKGKNVRTY